MDSLYIFTSFVFSCVQIFGQFLFTKTSWFGGFLISFIVIPKLVKIFKNTF